MAKKDDRNLNITIKNQEEKENEVVVSISTVLKKLRKYVLIWLVVAVLFVVFSLGYATITTHVSKPSLVALISFSYDGIEKGLDPNGRKFEVTSVKSPAVIEAALDELGMDMTNLEPIRQGIAFEGITPNYFYETYGYNESLGSAVTTINYADYDYSEAVDVFDNSLTTLEKYVRQLSKEDTTRFRSAETGYTFDDLYESIKTVESIDLDKISSYVTVNNLTKDKDEALAYYEYRIKALNRSKAQYEEEIASYDASIAAYQKDQIIVFGNGTDNTNTESTLASEQYDKMIQAKNDIATSLAQTKQSINYYKERQESLKNNPVGSSSTTEKVEADLASLNEKITALVDTVNKTSDDYYRNVTFKNAYSVLVPATNTATDRISHIIENAKQPLLILEALGFMVFFCVAFIEALIADNKKRKALARGAAVNDNDETAEVEETTPEEVVEVIADEAEKTEDAAEDKGSSKNSSNNNGKNNKKKK